MVRNKEIVGHVSGHSLAEAYAVLTRTPFTPPIYSAEAWKLLSENVLPFCQIVALTPAMYRETISRMFRERMDWRQDLRRFAFTRCEESRLRSNLHFQRSPLSTVGSRLGGTDRRTLAVHVGVKRRTRSTTTRNADEFRRFSQSQVFREEIRADVLMDLCDMAGEEGFDFP